KRCAPGRSNWASNKARRTGSSSSTLPPWIPGASPTISSKTKGSWPNCPSSSAPFPDRNPRAKVWKSSSSSSEAPTDLERPAKILGLAVFDLHLDLVPVNGLREGLDHEGDSLLHGEGVAKR